MSPTLPTFSPTKDHDGQGAVIHNPLVHRCLGPLAAALSTSDPKSCGYVGVPETTPDYDGPQRATGMNRSPLCSPLSYTGTVSRGTGRPNAGHAVTDDRLARLNVDRPGKLAHPLASDANGAADRRPRVAGIRAGNVPRVILRESAEGGG